MIADVFQQRKVSINCRIDQPIRQIIRVNALPRGAFLQPQTGSDQIEAIASNLNGLVGDVCAFTLTAL